MNNIKGRAFKKLIVNYGKYTEKKAEVPDKSVFLNIAREKLDNIESVSYLLLANYLFIKM